MEPRIVTIEIRATGKLCMDRHDRSNRCPYLYPYDDDTWACSAFHKLSGGVLLDTRLENSLDHIPLRCEACIENEV
jgi:hypothetical protein